MGTLSEPSVGRPVSLGHERDLADAAAILRIMCVLHDRRRAGASVHKIARESVWFLWESPRLPRPLVRSKYPESYPWSPGARQALQSVLDEGQAAGRVTGLIIEHLIPMKLLLDAALAQGPQLSDEGMLGLLHEHGAAAVMSTTEDRQITKAGYSRSMPPRWVVGEDPWARVRAAGLDPQTFRPVE